LTSLIGFIHKRRRPTNSMGKWWSVMRF
jgi:hypothetical protein